MVLVFPSLTPLEAGSPMRYVTRLRVRIGSMQSLTNMVITRSSLLWQIHTVRFLKILCALSGWWKTLLRRILVSLSHFQIRLPQSPQILLLSRCRGAFFSRMRMQLGAAITKAAAARFVADGADDGLPARIFCERRALSRSSPLLDLPLYHAPC